MIDDHLGDLLQQHFASDQRLHTDADRRSHAATGDNATPVRPSSDLLHGRHEFVTFAMHRPDDQLLAAIVTDGLADSLDPRRQR
jgi:hypothetical protein